MDRIRIDLPVRDWVITFSYRQHLDYAKIDPAIQYNGGVDFYSDHRNIYACDDGEVVKIGFDASGYGYFIKLRHCWGYSIYAHLHQTPTLPIGAKISASEPIGIMGSTGFSTGVHLHFETRDLQNRVFDPSPHFGFADDHTVGKIEIDDEVEVCSAFGANFRRKPSFDYSDVICRLKPGQKLRIIGDSVEFGNLIWMPAEVVTTGFIAVKDGDGTELIRKE